MRPNKRMEQTVGTMATIGAPPAAHSRCCADIREPEEEAEPAVMENDPWKPWSGATLFRGCLFVPALFIVGVGLLMLSMLPSLHATLATKALVVVLVAAVIGCAVATMMWSRVSRHVLLEGGLWEFLSGAPPEYPEALSAWRWGRRFRVCWIAAAAAMGAIALTEALAGHW